MKIISIALNTFKESARNKIFYLLVAFGVFFILCSQFLSMLSMGDTNRVLKDVGLAAIHFITVVITIFTGINLIYKEIDKRTVYNILSKPISRDGFIVGKFLGLALTLFTALSSLMIIFLLFYWVSTGESALSLLLYFFMLYLELLVLTALSLLFSAFTTPILSFIFTLSLFLIGHIMWTYNQFKYLLKIPWQQVLVKFLYYLLPNLDKFNIKNVIVLDKPIPAAQITDSILYAVVYIAALLVLTVVIFRRKEFQ